MKRYCKANLNEFFTVKIFDDDKLFYLQGRLFMSN